MNRILPLVVCVLLCSCAVNKKYIDYAETKNELAKNSFSRILIVGTGTSGTHLFLQNLSEELNKRLKQNNVETSYFHLGNNQVQANKMFDDIIQKNTYDAVLLFAQLDGNHDPVIIHSGGGEVPTRNGGSIMFEYSYRTIRFQQQFLIKYFNISDLSRSIVDAKLDIKMDFLNPDDYSTVSEKIIQSLRFINN